MKHFLLKNGIEAVLYSISEVRSITTFIGLPAGSSLEAPEDVGTIHFLEHVLLRGSKKSPTITDVHVAEEELGLSTNAWVSNLDTKYWFLSPDKNFRATLDFVFDRMANPILSEESVAISRDVILTEQRNHWDVPENNFYKMVKEAILGKEHIYIRRGFGETDVVAKMTREKVKACYEKYFVPENMKIAVAGDIKENEVRKLLESTFGALKKGKRKVDFARVDRLETKRGLKVYNQPRKQVIFNISFPSLGFKEEAVEKRLTTGLFNYMLGGGYSSLLYERLREELALVYGVSSGRPAWPYAGYLEVHGEVGIENLRKAMGEIFRILKRVKTKGLDKGKLERARNYLSTKALVGFSGTDNVSEYFLDEMLFEEKVRMPEDYNKLREKITLEDVNRIGRDLLDFGRVNLNLMGDVSLIEKTKIKEIFEKV